MGKKNPLVFIIENYCLNTALTRLCRVKKKRQDGEGPTGFTGTNTAERHVGQAAEAPPPQGLEAGAEDAHHFGGAPGGRALEERLRGGAPGVQPRLLW